jgi:hypothetical protein
MLDRTRPTWNVLGGTALFALQELAGWETEKTVRRFQCGQLELRSRRLE